MPRELAHQPRLANARVARDQHRRPASRLGPPQRLLEALELLGSPDQRRRRSARRRRAAAIGRDDRQEAPFASDAGERPAPAIGELEPGAGDEILDRLRDEHLPGGSLGSDAGGDVQSDPAHPPIGDLDLAGVHASADDDPVGSRRVGDRGCAADGSRGAVEAGQEPACNALQLAAAIAGELPAHDLVVGRRGGPSRADDLGGDERDEHALVVRRYRGAAFGQERLHDIEDLIGIDADEVIGSPQLDEAGARNPLGDVPTLLDAYIEVGAAVDDEGGDVDRP